MEGGGMRDTAKLNSIRKKVLKKKEVGKDNGRKKKEINKIKASEPGSN